MSKIQGRNGLCFLSCYGMGLNAEAVASTSLWYEVWRVVLTTTISPHFGRFVISSRDLHKEDIKPDTSDHGTASQELSQD